MTKLIDLCDIQYGYAFDSNCFSKDNSYPQLARIRDVKRGYSETFYTGKYPKEYVLSAGDLLIGMDGEFNVARWKIDGALLNQRVCKVVAKNGTNEEYIRFFLLKQLKTIEEKTSFVTVKHLSAREINKIEVDIPKLCEQEKIATTLLMLERIEELRNRELLLLDELVRGRFVELFGDPVHNDKGWETDTVENLCKKIYGGGTPSKVHPEYYEEGDIPWVSSKDMKTDVLTDSQIKINQLGVDNSTAKIVPVNSVIVVIRSGILKHTLPVAINAVPITVNQDLKVFIPGERMVSRFLAVQFKMHEKDILTGVRAVTADNIEFNLLKQRKLIVPPIELQKEYVTFVTQIDKSKFVERFLELSLFYGLSSPLNSEMICIFPYF